MYHRYNRQSIILSCLKVVCSWEGDCRKSAAGIVIILARVWMFTVGHRLFVSSVEEGRRAARAECGPCNGSPLVQGKMSVTGCRQHGEEGTSLLRLRVKSKVCLDVALAAHAAWWQRVPCCQLGMSLPCVSARLWHSEWISSCLGCLRTCKKEKRGDAGEKNASLLGCEE